MDRIIPGDKVRLRPKRLSDAVEDYAWRTDSELSSLDATQPLTLPFEEYLRRYAAEIYILGDSSLNFAIETKESKHIGNCACFAIGKVKGEAELGIIIGDRTYWDQGYGVDAINTLLHYLFSEMNLDRVHLKTLDWNDRAQRCFQKCGFSPCGRLIKDGYNFILMEIPRYQFEAGAKGQNQTS